MDEIRIRARSSSGEPYDVIFANQGPSFTVFCTCKAGQRRKLCKHKTQLLLGDESMLHDAGDAARLQEVRTWVAASGSLGLLKEYAGLKEQIEAAKANERRLRSRLEKAMKEGIPFREEV